MRTHREEVTAVASPIPLRIAFTIQEAAQASTLSKSKLYELMKAGELHFVNVGSRRLILVKELESFLCGGAA